MAPRLFGACMGRGGKAAAGAAEEGEELGPVLVELFSSQGCGTSAEAEAVASQLGREEAGVVVLAWHVEYWDYRGWKDPFGSSMWTVRQKAYVEALRLDTLYTPQAVVHGRAQCLATDQPAILDALHASPRFAAPTMQATFSKPAPDTLQVSVTGALRTRVDSGGADVMVALYESGLVTDCTRGENKGRMLNNDHVVRRLEKLCGVKDISAKKTVSGSVRFPLWEGFDSNKCGIILFVQNSSMHTFGVQHFHIPDTI